MKLLTTRNVAESLGLSSRYVCMLAAANKITPFATLANKQLVFTEQELTAFKARKEAKNAK
jgi:hypothetical protein